MQPALDRTLELAEEMKKRPRKHRQALRDKILAMIFQKPSLRTRMTFEVGMLQLGGSAIYMSPADGQVGTRETFFDVGKNLERWVDAVVIRTFAQERLVEITQATPNLAVINALSNEEHPCQALADMLTLIGDERVLDVATGVVLWTLR